MEHYLGYENLDLDRLNQANMHWPEPRGQGRTFKFMMHMLSCAHVCDDGSRYVYIGENMYWSRHLARELKKVLEAERFTVDYNDDLRAMRVTSRPQHQVDFYFGPPSDAYKFSRGQLWTDIFVDLTDRRESRYSKQLYDLSYRIME